MISCGMETQISIFMHVNFDDTVTGGFLYDPPAYTLGFKELLLLAFILFFGFCGFTICVDKLYSNDLQNDKINSVILHDESLSTLEVPNDLEYPAGYQVHN